MTHHKRSLTTAAAAFVLVAGSAILFSAVVFGQSSGQARPATAVGTRSPNGAGAVFQPSQLSLGHFAPVNFAELAKKEAESPMQLQNEQEFEPPVPGPKPVIHSNVKVPYLPTTGPAQPQSAAATGTPSAMWSKTFQAVVLSSTSIPPDTMGAVGTTHVMTVTNDKILIQLRDGRVVSGPVTLTSFWNGVTVKGQGVSAFDPKIYFDRFNNRFIFESSANGPGVNSGAMFAVSATADPTGAWYRWSVVADSSSTGVPNGSGTWIDYPTVGFNKDWIVVDENVFTYTCNASSCANSGYWGQQVYVLDKQAAYSNTLGAINLFASDFANTCVNSATQNSELGCGFTMAPTIVEDNTTDVVYLVEDWDSTSGQLRLSKITGTPSAPALTVGTQFPQSINSWRFDAARIGTSANCGGTCSGGYMPQRQQSANLPSSQRVMANDSRIQNSVLRNGNLWCAHTVMLSSSAQPAGTTIGGTGNPIDNHSGIQWWEIDPTIETGTAAPPLQRGRIEDPTANNCHNGSGGTSSISPCNGTTSAQFGEFFAFPNISVNANGDVLLGFSHFSPLTYPSSGYAIRLSTDLPNTTRDPVIFRSGQANYNIGGFSGTNRQNRWGDYSSAQTDPADDTSFWSIQEYSGTVRDFGIGLAGNWETWWAMVSPSNTTPSTGSLEINEFRLRGPQGIRDEFVELYNPSDTPLVVEASDGTEGWGLAFSPNGTSGIQQFAVIPNGMLIAPRGHFLLADSPDASNGPGVVYSLNSYPGSEIRTANSDFGWSLDLADNGGLGLFTTSNTANYSSSTELDAAGFSSIAAGLFKQGNGIPAITATTPTGQTTFFRSLASGLPQATQVNENDFLFADTALETFGAVTPYLGAPGPENLGSPIHANGNDLVVTMLDPNVPSDAYPNFAYDPTPDANDAAGTAIIRRVFTNNSGQSITRLRFRIVSITGPTNQQGGSADLRVRSSTGPEIVTLSDTSTRSVDATTLEEPPTQSNGGGDNSSLRAGTVTLAAPLADGNSIALSFLFGVQQTGTATIAIEAEGIPGVSTFFTASGTADDLVSATPTPTPTPIATATPTPTASPTATATASPTATATASPTATATASPTASPTATATASPTATATASPTATATASPTPNPTATASPTATATASPTATPIATATPTATPSPIPTTPTPSPTITPGATVTPTVTPQATATPTATPNATATPTVTPASSATPTPTATATPAATRNISTRDAVGTGEHQEIGGFIISGDANRRILIRGLGASLRSMGVEGAIDDPFLVLHEPDGAVLVSNDNWRDAQEADIEATGIPPTDDLESAIIINLPPGNYTAILGGKNGTTGVGQVEIYDIDQTVGKLGNLSTRGDVGTDANVLIAGVILSGGSSEAIFRGVGPSLAKRGVAAPLADPMLEVRNANGDLMMSNDNWQDDPAQAALITASGIPPEDPKESAIVLVNPPAGAYTAILAGKDNGTGVGLVETYIK